jgi:hypothetical protein
MYKFVIVVLVLIFSIGCERIIPNEPLCNIGKVKSAGLVPTSFNEAIKMMVVTDKGIYVIYGCHSFEYEKDAMVKCCNIAKGGN